MSSNPKRKHFRHKTSLPAKVRSRGTFTWVPSHVHNLSKGGILLEAEGESSFEVGDTVEIEFQTTDKAGATHQRRFIGNIMWRRGVRFGIEFKVATSEKAPKG